jgi:hypothetical protein
MRKKGFSILMMSVALAIMLGHNIIPHHHHHDEQHHHHDFEHKSHAHHHDHNHQHGSDNDESDNSELPDLLAKIQHGDNGITFLSSQHIANPVPVVVSSFAAILPVSFVSQKITERARQNSPPYKHIHQAPHYLLPTGLRAPPTFIV